MLLHQKKSATFLLYCNFLLLRCNGWFINNVEGGYIL